jgi:hypothetical protein
MTQSPGGRAPSHDTHNSQSTTEVARNEAAELARTAARSGSDVAETVGDQARRVTAETTRQARDLLEEGKGQLAEQARNGQRKAAEGLHTLADQLQKMTQSSDGGVAPELAQQAAERARTVASWLERREPGDLLTELRTFARRKPGVFLAGAALAGVLAGRLTRSMVASGSDTADEGTAERGRPAGTVPSSVPAAPALPAHADQPPAFPVAPEVPGHVPPSGAVTPPGSVAR